MASQTTHRRNDDTACDGSTRDFVEMLHGIIPTLDRIRRSIEESSGRIPTASTQLSNVTSATESATVEILNTLESVTQRLESMQKNLQELRHRNGERDRIAHAVRSLVIKLQLANGERAAFEECWRDYLNYGTDISTLEGIEKELHETKHHAMDIAIALQVQDITSQQIAGVNHMIEAVRLKLASALSDFEHPVREGTPEAGESDAPDQCEADGPKTFDSGAVYTKSTDRQVEADELIKQWTQGGGA